MTCAGTPRSRHAASSACGERERLASSSSHPDETSRTASPQGGCAGRPFARSCVPSDVRPHSGLVRLHPWAMWSAMQASCCDHGFNPHRVARHVVVSPVRGLCIATSVAQPGNRQATTISVRYRRARLLPPGYGRTQLPTPGTWVPLAPMLPCAPRCTTVSQLGRRRFRWPPRVNVAPPADRRVASPRRPVGSTSPHPGPGRALPCRRSGWPGPARA
jgi:hypothetical protein